jgi:hypothetical protein
MNALQREALRVIVMQIARLIKMADAAEHAARTTRERAADARMSYQLAPTAAAENAMLRASIRENLAFEKSLEAEDAVKAGFAAREFVFAALREEELGETQYSMTPHHMRSVA